MVCDDLSQLRAAFKRGTVREFPGYETKIHTLRWNAEGSRLASGSSDKLVNIYALESTGRLAKLQTLRGHTESVDQLAWHPSHNDTLVSVAADGVVRLWDSRAKRAPVTAQLKGENINVAWSPNARTIAVGNKADLVSWLDVRAGLRTLQAEQFSCEINEFAWRPPGPVSASAAANTVSSDSAAFFLTTGVGSILVYGGRPGEMTRELTLHGHPVNAMCLQFSPDGEQFAVGGADALVSVWDARDLVCVRTLSRLEWPVHALGFSHCGQLIAAASEDYFVDVGHAATGEQVAQIGTQAAATLVLAWHPAAWLLSYSSMAKHDRDQGVIRLFSVPSASQTVDGTVGKEL